MPASHDKTRELIVIRSLTDSDLGIFAIHRNSATSKQRAVNINASIAKQILSQQIFKSGDTHLDCITAFNGKMVRECRSFKKVHKNWRLGGKKINGEEFASLDSKDFMLLRTIAENDGSTPVAITFVGKKTDQVIHAGIVAILEKRIDRSMAVFFEQDDGFEAIARYCPSTEELESRQRQKMPIATAATFPPMPRHEEEAMPQKPLSMRDKIQQPHILSKMLQVAGDLSAPAQLRFMQTVGDLAFVMREILLATGRIIKIEKDHHSLWKSVAGMSMGFIDGGLANLSMLGSAPIAARVGGYTVTPGNATPERETFTVLKYLIDELYAADDNGVFDDSFPDLGALRDAARISIEAAGAVRLLAEKPSLKWVMLHGSLVSPVSRYTDVIQDGEIRHRFPNFSDSAIQELLPADGKKRTDRECNFICIYLRQLEFMMASNSIVCGVAERSGTTSTVCKTILYALKDHELQPLLCEPPAEWRRKFLKLLDPAEDDGVEGQRITDSLLFRCVLEPGEAILPVPVDRNLLRKAPLAWKDIIAKYPRPMVAYLQATEWNAPIRIEMFEKNIADFHQTAEFIMHCSLLLPRYVFPAGLDIVDKYAKIPNWMSRPINTHMAVRSLKQALDSGDVQLFDSLRRMLCGTKREWMLRPGVYR